VVSLLVVIIGKDGVEGKIFWCFWKGLDFIFLIVDDERKYCRTLVLKTCTFEYSLRQYVFEVFVLFFTLRGWDILGNGMLYATLGGWREIFFAVSDGSRVGI